MVTYVLSGGSDILFDPAVGEGAFFRAAKVVSGDLGRHIRLLGREIHSDALRQAAASGLGSGDLNGVELRDFLLEPPSRKYSAIAANPPYIRHHRLSPSLKSHLRDFGSRLLGESLDGRAGLHVYFLLQALSLLSDGGRLAFIMPADTCEGVFAKPLWRWISKRYCLDAVVAFQPNASPFPGVDTNALVFLIRNDAPKATFLWCECNARGRALREWCRSVNIGQSTAPELRVVERVLAEGLSTGLSRPPSNDDRSGPPLGDYAKVMRGIATGANAYFFLTQAEIQARKLPKEFLRRAIGRTRDVEGDEITEDSYQRLMASGRPCFLLSPDARPVEQFPRELRDYLKAGHQEGVGSKVLIATRNPWYKMEVRVPPPYLFAYLGRRNARFIRNTARVVPLTGFLCVYPRDGSLRFADGLWKVLNHPDTIQNLKLVGKSYGGGAIKVEPRALEQLPLPAGLVEDAGLHAANQGDQLVFATSSG